MFRHLPNATAFSFQRIVVIVAVLIALTGLPRSAVAQAVYGSIAGTVTDPSGGALPGVSVTITSVERKTTDTVVTNETGHYVKERLLPGTYEVKIELSGFKQSVYPNIVKKTNMFDYIRRACAGTPHGYPLGRSTEGSAAGGA